VDLAKFDDFIVGVSLVSAATMTFRSTGRTIHVALPARSAYVMTGPARYDFTHELNDLRAPRISITLRKLRCDASGVSY
jgi:alkylated DNA repair dioxygenase AlkB